MMHIYIAGPITGTNDYEERFAAAEKKLKSLGFEVTNPVGRGKKLEKICEKLNCTEASYRDYINFGLLGLKLCDTVYLLNGWFASKGASLEQTYARVVGMPIIQENDPEAEKKLTELMGIRRNGKK